MDGRIMKWGLMLLLCIPFWTACNNDDVPEAAIEPQKIAKFGVYPFECQIPARNGRPR